MAWAQDGPPAPVSVDEARADTFSAAFWVSGTVISRNDARIAAETDGRITWVAEVGTRIDRGQPFATIDDTDLRLELSDNKAQLESVAERLVQVGEFVSRGVQVARLVDTENREIRAQAPLTISSYVREGLEVSIEHQQTQSLSPVTRVIPVGDERSRMFEVRIAAVDPAWVIGSPVRVALPNSIPRELVAIHRDALVLRGSELFVLRVSDDNTVEKVQVDTGIGLGELVEVIGDLSGGDRVVTRGAERLRSGQTVVVAGGP
jgi:hypothetical protein